MWKTMWSTFFVSVFFGCVLGVNEESTGVVSEEERQGSLRGAAKKERASLEQRTSLSLPQERTYAEEDVALSNEEILDEVVEEWMNGKGDGSVDEEESVFGMVTKETENGEPVGKEDLLEDAYEIEKLIYKYEQGKKWYEEDAKNKILGPGGETHIQALKNLLHEHEEEQRKHEDEMKAIEKECKKEEERYANEIGKDSYDLIKKEYKKRKKSEKLRHRSEEEKERNAARIEELQHKYNLENLRCAKEIKGFGFSYWMKNWEKIYKNESWKSAIEGRTFVHEFENLTKATGIKCLDGSVLKATCEQDPFKHRVSVVFGFLAWVCCFIFARSELGDS
ncbi:MAG: uncharacterized protein A8A55_1727 [Amphiamblys sp. WSBS2006]|nr:MAG: uncharacterized protein A8A55_1727 [Amphiamblys sp. WSBS2006]